MLPNKIRIATRKSPLAVWQAEHVATQLKKHNPTIEVELVKMVTQGDRVLDTPLTKVGGKGLFVKELEAGMLAGDADIAVHSMKDVPMQFPEGLCLPVILARENPQDALVANFYNTLEDLPAGGVVGTSSLRRASQIKSKFPALKIRDCRGNVNTRLDKLDDGQYDAIILAAAGLTRLGMQRRISKTLAIDESLPAIGQGAIGIECRAADHDLITLLSQLDDELTHQCVTAERAVNARLGGSCEIPIAGHAVLREQKIYLRGMVASPNGTEVFSASASGDDPQQVGLAVAEDLLQRGAGKVLQALGLPGS